MRKLRVMKMYQCAFVKYDEKTHRLLKTCEPYVTWGPPEVRTIRELLTKRGFADVNVSKRPIVTNKTCLSQPQITSNAFHVPSYHWPVGFCKLETRVCGWYSFLISVRWNHTLWKKALRTKNSFLFSRVSNDYSRVNTWCSIQMLQSKLH